MKCYRFIKIKRLQLKIVFHLTLRRKIVALAIIINQKNVSTKIERDTKMTIIDTEITTNMNECIEEKINRLHPLTGEDTDITAVKSIMTIKTFTERACHLTIDIIENTRTQGSITENLRLLILGQDLNTTTAIERGKTVKSLVITIIKKKLSILIHGIIMRMLGIKINTLKSL